MRHDDDRVGSWRGVPEEVPAMRNSSSQPSSFPPPSRASTTSSSSTIQHCLLKLDAIQHQTCNQTAAPQTETCRKVAIHQLLPTVREPRGSGGMTTWVHDWRACRAAALSPLSLPLPLSFLPSPSLVSSSSFVSIDRLISDLSSNDNLLALNHHCLTTLIGRS